MVNSFFLAPAFHIPVAGLRNVVVLVGSFKPVGDCWQLWFSGMQSVPWVSFYPRTARGCLSTVVGLRNAGLPLPPIVFSSSPVRTTCSRPLCSLSSNRAHTGGATCRRKTSSRT